MPSTPPIEGLETPLGHVPAVSPAAIFTMPKEYRGLSGAALFAAHPPGESRPIAPPSVVLPPKIASSTKHRRISKTTLVLLCAGGIIIVAFLVAAVLLLRTTPAPVPYTEPIPVPAPAPTTSPVVPTPVPVVPEVLRPGVDTDSDGLTDTEETLYGTNSRLPDTDGDGFLDGNEVFHRYDPSRLSPSTLLSAKIVVPVSLANKVTILAPVAWVMSPQISPTSPNPPSITFTVPTGESVRATVEGKDATVSLSDWYASHVTNKTAINQAGITKNGYPMLTSSDKLTVWIDAGTVVISFVYDPGKKTTVDYLQTFYMMLNSIEHTAGSSDVIPVPSTP